MVRVTDTVTEGIDWLESGYDPGCLVLDMGLTDPKGDLVVFRGQDKGVSMIVALCAGIVDRERLAVLRADVLLFEPVSDSDIATHVQRFVQLHDAKNDLFESR